MSGEKYINHVLKELETAENPLMDSVHQVKMPSWSKGNVVLGGDAAWCLSLYSGMGASSGILGAKVLGEQLTQHPNNMKEGLAEYEASMRSFIKKHQRSALFKAQILVPSNPMYSFVRTKMLGIISHIKYKKEA